MDSLSTDVIKVRDSKFGKGVFAWEDISKGALIIRIKGKNLSFNDSLELGDTESHCLQVGINKYIIPDGLFRYCNHSCDPNSGINSRLELVALRSIPKGEEVAWDYSTSMMERHWTMHCHCGSPLCRQLINDFDLLPIHTQKLYFHLGIVLPFIKHYLSQSRLHILVIKK